MDIDRLASLVAAGEALDVEFKSDRSGPSGTRPLDDNDILETVVALTNYGRGVLLIGVEDDGRITGLNAARRDKSPSNLRAFINNHTQPPVSVEVSLVDHPQGAVMAVEVLPQIGVIYATSAARMLKRAMGLHGPENRPLFPYEVASILSTQRQVDYTEQLLTELDYSALDPLEMERLRQTIERNSGRSDAALSGVEGEELAKALGIVRSDGRRMCPTIAGLLVAGRESVLRRYVPTHQINFQVIDNLDNVRVNDSFRLPLVAALESVEQRFSAHNRQQEVMAGMFRVDIPDYSPIGFREAINNAIVHRDYTVMGEIYIQWRPDHLLITNPGGFMPGITLENLIYHEPLPRNPLLADIFKRLGLVERTARGVDRIYHGQLRFGRPVPDYSRSDQSGVRVVLPGGAPSLDFVRLVYNEERAQGGTLPLDQLMALNHLFFARRTDAPTLAAIIQRDTTSARALLERLVERGLVEARGNKARTYHFSAHVYAATGHRDEYVRARGFTAVQQPQMVLQYLRAHGRITRREAAELCRIDSHSASKLLRQMTHDGLVRMVGNRKAAHYVEKR